MAKPSKSIWIGLGIGIACILTSMVMSGEFQTFLNWPSVFITIGGTLGAVVVSFPAERLKTLGPVMRKAFQREPCDFEKDIRTIVGLAEVARQRGLLALEDYADQKIDDKFLKRGVYLIVDGADEDHLRSTLQAETYFMQQRHQKGYAMLDMIATTAPSLGLLGTYIGLIPMLVNLDDPTQLGPLMAVELVTSFYGAFLAYVIFAPLSKRLKIMDADEVGRREFLLEGLAAIEESKSPRVIEEDLIAYLSEKRSTRGSSRRLEKFPPRKAA
mgnify:CR=1 FL=1